MPEGLGDQPSGAVSSRRQALTGKPPDESRGTVAPAARTLYKRAGRELQGDELQRKRKPVATGAYFWVPNGFDATSIPELRGLADEAHWLLSKIITTAPRYRHEPGFDGWVHISRQTMKE